MLPKPPWMDSTVPASHGKKLEKAVGDLWKSLQRATFSAVLYACPKHVKQLLLDTVVYLSESSRYGHQSWLCSMKSSSLSPCSPSTAHPRTLPWDQQRAALLPHRYLSSLLHRWPVSVNGNVLVLVMWTFVGWDLDRAWLIAFSILTVFVWGGYVTSA